MEPPDEEVDTEDLLLHTVDNRAKYTFHIQKVLAKCSKHRLKSFETQNTNEMDWDETRLSKLNLSIKNVELDILNKKLQTEVKNTLKEQIRTVMILNKKKNCPISQKMDKLRVYHTVQRPIRASLSYDYRRNKAEVAESKATKICKIVKNTVPQQTLLSAASFKSGPKLSVFNKDLCCAFVSAGIPLYKLKNGKLKEFLEHHTKQLVPDESTLRKHYVPIMYQQSIEEIRAKVGENCIWVTLDETTDVCGRYVANFVVGVLAAEEEQCRSYLLTLDVLPKVNHSTIAVFFNDALSLLRPAIKYHKVLLVCTDAASYMVKAMEGLKILYSKMIHVTCLAHGLHRVAETVRSENPEVNELISVVKKIFVKAPSRITTFQEKAPNIPLPPEPAVTRWGTWLTAAEYYADNFEIVKTVIDSLDPSEAKAVETAQEIFKKNRVREKLIFIKTHFMCIPPAIVKLEKHGVLLSENLKIVKSVVDKIKAVPKTTAAVTQKLSFVLDKNSGFRELQDICCVLNGNSKDQIIL